MYKIMYKFQSLKIVFILANSADPDEMLPYAAFHLDPHSQWLSYPDFYENDEIFRGLIQTIGLPYFTSFTVCSGDI